MKNIFKFNRVFSVLLLLSVVTNASAVRFNYEACGFVDHFFGSPAASTEVLAPAVSIKVPAVTVTEVATPAPIVDFDAKAFDAVETADIAKLAVNYAALDAADLASAPVTVTEVSAPAVTAEVPTPAVPTVDPIAVEKAALDAFISREAAANEIAQLPIGKGKTPDQLKEMLKTEMARNAAEVDTPAVEVKPTWTFGSLWNSAKTSTVGNFISSNYNRGCEAASAQYTAHPTATKAVIGAVVVSAVGYMLYRYYNQAKTAPVVPAPVVPAPVVPASTYKTPITFPEFITLNNQFKTTPADKNILNAMQTGFNTSGKSNAGIVRYLAGQFKVANTVEAVSAKLAELIAA